MSAEISALAGGFILLGLPLAILLLKHLAVCGCRRPVSKLKSSVEFEL